MIQAELDLPFNEVLYAQALEAGHKKQKEHFDAFILNIMAEHQIGSEDPKESETK